MKTKQYIFLLTLKKCCEIKLPSSGTSLSGLSWFYLWVLTVLCHFVQVMAGSACVLEGQLPVMHILAPKSAASSWETGISIMPNQLWVRLQHGLRPVMIYIWWDGTSVFQFGLFTRNLLAGVSLKPCPGITPSMWQDNWNTFSWAL